jgi:hypothetical protein
MSQQASGVGNNQPYSNSVARQAGDVVYIEHFHELTPMHLNSLWTYFQLASDLFRRIPLGDKL